MYVQLIKLDVLLWPTLKIILNNKFLRKFNCHFKSLTLLECVLVGVFFPNFVSYVIYDYLGNKLFNILLIGDIPRILLVFVLL